MFHNKTQIFPLGFKSVRHELDTEANRLIDIFIEVDAIVTLPTTAGIGGFYSTRIVVDHDYNVAYAHTDVIGQAELRGSFMVAAYGDGTGTLHYQQIQSAGGPS